MKAYYRGDKELGYKIISDRDFIIKTCDEYLKKRRTAEVSTIIYGLKAVITFIRNIARLVIDKE